METMIVVCVLGGYWVIDPKLRAVSSEYEARQAAYLRDLVAWETANYYADPGVAEAARGWSAAGNGRGRARSA